MALAKKKPAKKAKAAKKPAAQFKSAPRANNILKWRPPSLVAQLAASNPAHNTSRLAPRLQAVVDKSEIAEVIATFGRSLDRLDENLLRSVLQPDATIDLGPGVFQGTGNDYVHWVLGVLAGVKSSHHLLGPSLVTLEGDAALAETYFHAHFRLDKPTGREDVFMGGRFLDRLERRPAGPAGIWKIMHRKQALDWVRTESVSDIFYHQNPDALWSYRAKTDPSYQMAQFPGTNTGARNTAFFGRRYESRSMKF
ncbi:MAG: nuclear transport factor 2 family protein [Bdellovibrionales bacterium]